MRTLHIRHPNNHKRVIIIAGEASGDLHGSHLVTAMKRLDSEIEFWGIGGEKMANAGVHLLLSSSDMAVVGLTEVFSKLRTILRAAKTIKSIIRNERPDLLILIDYPDFNIHVAGTAKKFNTPVLYYISPQVWAWRRGRINKIARRVDRMAVILPFEKDYYRDKPIRVDYVGHPLLDGLTGDKVKRIPSPEVKKDGMFPVVGLVPGSRKEEIRSLLPVMVDAARILKTHYPDIHCVLPVAPGIETQFIQTFIDNSNLKIQLLSGNLPDLLIECDVAMVTSGTATLETAIAEVPMVIVYRMSPISFWVAKTFIKVPYIGLVNLVAKKAVVPELIQAEGTPERLAFETRRILEVSGVRERMLDELRLVKEKLGTGGASEKTAKIALEMMR